MKKSVFLLLLLLVGINLGAQKPGDTSLLTELILRKPAVQTEDMPTRPDSTVFPLIWRVRDRMLTTGRVEDVDFLVFNFNDIAAYQFALQFDPGKLRFEELQLLTTGIPLDPAGNFGLFNLSAGEIRTLWSAATGMNLPRGAPVFRLRFTVLAGEKKLSEVLSLNPGVLTPIGYNTVLAPRPVELAWADYLHIKPREQEAQTEITEPLLLQNRPNPFINQTVIGFTLPEAGNAQLRVMDISGRELYRVDKSYPAGYNEELIQLRDIRATGILYYELTTPSGKLTRKMTAVAP